jgi:hypothetical protein
MRPPQSRPRARTLLQHPAPEGLGVAVDVCGEGGTGTDKQPGGACGAAGCVMAATLVRLSQRRWPPLRGAYLDGRADAPRGKAIGADVPGLKLFRLPALGRADRD